jgi:hypothetical protein
VRWARIPRCTPVPGFHRSADTRVLEHITWLGQKRAPRAQWPLGGALVHPRRMRHAGARANLLFHVGGVEQFIFSPAGVVGTWFGYPLGVQRKHAQLGELLWLVGWPLSDTRAAAFLSSLWVWPTELALKRFV